MSKQVFLNSADADVLVGESRSDIIFNFDNPIYVADNQALSIVVLNAQIPTSFFVVNATSDVLTHSLADSYFDDLVTVVLTKGNPNVTYLMSDLQSKMPGLTITYDGSTNQLTFTNSTSFQFGPPFTAHQLLGFPSDYCTCETVTAGVA